jgi:hypothetical protein
MSKGAENVFSPPRVYVYMYNIIYLSAAAALRCCGDKKPRARGGRFNIFFLFHQHRLSCLVMKNVTVHDSWNNI